MIRPSSRWLAIASLAALLAACGEGELGNGQPDAGDPPRVQTKVLTRVGPGALSAHPGDKMTLRALLSMSEVGGVPDAKVTWRITEDPGNTALSVDSSATGADGVADTELTLGDPGTVSVRADSAGVTSKAVWKIDVQPVVKHLRIVEGTDVTNTDPSALKATVKSAVGRSTILRVRVSSEDGDNERPVPSEQVTFAFQSTISGAAFQGNTSGVTQTQGDGEANIVLTAGSVSGSYSVVASIAGGIYVTFDVAVSGSGSSGSCTTNTQCPAGQICTGGACVNSTSGGTSCGANDRPCPIGYSCDSATGLCKPSFGGGCDHCPAGTHCDTSTNQCTADDPECSDSVPCPTGFACQNGICVPGDGTMDVTGHWYTKHDFDVRQALPGWVRFSGTAIRTIDQVFLGQLNVPSWVNSLIRGVVQQYIPPWVQTLVQLLDTMLTVFSTLRAEGEMDLAANGGPRILAGTETWTSFVFYMLSQCNGNIGGNSYTPACARVDIYTTELEQSDLAVDVLPFAAKVGGDATAGYTIIMDKRQAKMKFAGILKYVLDQAISITTGYPSLEDKPCTAGQDPNSGECGPGSGALSNLIDCAGISQWVQNDLGLPFDIEPICKVAVSLAGQEIAKQLKNVTVTQDVLEFNGQATARATNGVATYADELGYADYDTRSNPDGKWTSKFKIVVSVHDVPGRWRASREPFVQTP